MCIIIIFTSLQNVQVPLRSVPEYEAKTVVHPDGWVLLAADVATFQPGRFLSYALVQGNWPGCESSTTIRPESTAYHQV